MSTLAELFPAGAGKEVNFTASGAIAADTPVGLNTDGTVTAIGSPAPVSEAIPAAAAKMFAGPNDGTHVQGISSSSIAFDPNTAGEFVLAWVEAGVLKARVGSLSETAVTLGTIITVSAGTNTLSHGGVQYNPNVAKQFVIAFTDGGDSYKGKVALGTVASSAITMQGDVTYDSNNLGSGSHACLAFDPNTSGKFVIIYKRAGAAGNGLVCTISGTTITANSPSTFGTNCEHLNCAFDQNTANKVVAVYQGSPGDYGQAVVGTVDGTGISFGDVETFESGATQFPSVEYNPGAANKVVVAYKGDGQDGKASLGTVSGTDITFATPVVYDTGNAQNPSIAFDSNTANKFVISYNESSKLYLLTGTASSSTVSLDTPIEIPVVGCSQPATRFNPDSNSAGQFMTIFEDTTDPADPGTLILGQIAATRPKYASDFLGISKGAISDTASGTIVLKGGLVTTLSGLTPNATYYVHNDASMTSPTVPSAYTIDGATYDSVSFDVSGQTGTCTGLTFNNNGTKMYVTDENNNAIFQYSLSTAYDLSTASYDSVSINVNSQQEAVRSVVFNNNGTSLYITGTSNSAAHQYTLSTAYDLSTASYANKTVSLSSQELYPCGLIFNPDGTKMYIVGSGSRAFLQYTLSTAFDVSTASYASKTFGIISQNTSPTGIAFNSDGTKIFLSGESPARINQYSLSTAYDISTCSLDSVSYTVTEGTPLPRNIDFKDDGLKFYIADSSADTIYQYTAGGGPTSDVQLGRALSATTLDLEYQS